ncbi:hypothetical protein [Streptomyces sp. NBC_01465]|uniref:hypothetical protein n=1 Tax=Streptomyces sp. NBC_01465 TaxID=2903878 RepID=UPI002E33CFC3|nr:hypothetical protein [Streptomyces sp. NBC_01465]
MSQPTPPPSQPSEPQQGAFGFPAAPVPAPAPAPRPTNFAGGVLAAFAVAVFGAILYGIIANAIDREIGYAAVGLGFLVGLTACKVGGRSVWLFVWAAVFSLAGTYFGQLVAVALALSDITGAPSVTDIFLSHFGVLNDAWGEVLSAMRFVFIALGAVGAYAGAKKANG